MCHMMFGKEHGLRVHKGKMHSENERKHMEDEKDLVRCDICKYVGLSKEDLLSHKKELHSEPNFKCEKCNYAGVSLEEVRDHMLLMHIESGIKKSSKYNWTSWVCSLKKGQN